MKYTVHLIRIGYSHADIEVEADSHDEAIEKATDEAGDHHYSEKDAEYKVTGVTQGNVLTNIF